MNERYSASIGHRRWILDPFLGKISYGRVAQQDRGQFPQRRGDDESLRLRGRPAAAFQRAGLRSLSFGDYPVRYFGPGDILSFSAVVSSSSRYANGNVGFGSATVRVSDANGDLTVTDKATDNIGYGIPNSIQWKLTGLQPNVTYTVRITGVTGYADEQLPVYVQDRALTGRQDCTLA